MLKLKMIIKVLLAVAILLYFHPTDNSIAGSCDEKASSGGASTCTGDHTYSNNWNTAPVLDPNIPDEIAPNSSIPISVTRGCYPYTWSISGQGFTLAESVTKGLTNTLNSDGTSCGTATITIIGCSGTTIVGQVRITEGHWEYNTECSLWSSPYIIETTIGGEYSKTGYWCPNNSGSCPSGINPPSVSGTYWLSGGVSCYRGNGCDPYCDLIPCSLIVGHWVCN
jgi:hypothetical protein